MPRPTTKEDLLKLAEINYNKLLDFIEELPDEIKTKTYKNDELNDRDKTVSDIICHLYEWHQLLLNWIKSNRKGKETPFLPEPYNWKTYPALNREFWKKNQNTSLTDAKKMFKKSHKDVLAIIETFSNDELFGKNEKFYTGTSTLGAYCISATSSHYGWALKTIKPLKKMVKK